MRSTLIILMLFFHVSGFSQNSDEIFYTHYLETVPEQNMKKRIIFIKKQTDNLLFSSLSPDVKEKFFFAFPSSSFRGLHPHGYGRVGYSPLFRSEADTNIVDVIHSYQFHDKSIDLRIENIEVYFNDENGKELRYVGVRDSLIKEALLKVYTKGYLTKIVQKIKDVRFKHPFTVVDINEDKKAFNIILKDRKLPHNFYIQ